MQVVRPRSNTYAEPHRHPPLGLSPFAAARRRRKKRGSGLKFTSLGDVIHRHLENDASGIILPYHSFSPLAADDALPLPSFTSTPIRAGPVPHLSPSIFLMILRNSTHSPSLPLLRLDELWRDASAIEAVQIKSRNVYPAPVFHADSSRPSSDSNSLPVSPCFPISLGGGGSSPSSHGTLSVSLPESHADVVPTPHLRPTPDRFFRYLPPPPVSLIQCSKSRLQSYVFGPDDDVVAPPRKVTSLALRLPRLISCLAGSRQRDLSLSHIVSFVSYLWPSCQGCPHSLSLRRSCSLPLHC